MTKDKLLQFVTPLGDWRLLVWGGVLGVLGFLAMLAFSVGDVLLVQVWK